MSGPGILYPIVLLILSQICSSSSFLPTDVVHAPHAALSALSDDEEAPTYDDEAALKRLAQQYLGKNAESPSDNAKRLADLYDAEELTNLLNVHEGVSSRTEEKQKDAILDDEIDIPSIHDLVMQAVGEAPEPLSLDSDENANDGDEVLESLAKQRASIGSNPGRLPAKGEKASRLADLYGADELTSILNVHEGLSTRMQEIQKSAIEDESSEVATPSIHDLVKEAVGETAPPLPVVSGGSQEEGANEECAWLTDAIKAKMKGVTAIASDVDGTLIGSTQTVHPRTKDAVANAVQDSFSPLGKLKWFFPATGKTRWGAMNSLGPELAGLLKSCPGVFIQGLYCVVGDTVIFEKKLPTPAIEAAERLVERTQTSIIAYDGDDLYTNKVTESVTELHEVYGEPMSSEIPSIAEHAPGIHKILICDDDLDKIAEVRIELEALAKEHGATVTQALPTMLELLPEGCSKALGVEKLCDALGLDPTKDLMALGDAENDVEMLKLASVGVCVGNGSKVAKDAADIVLDETSDEGGAGLAIEVLTGLQK